MICKCFVAINTNAICHADDSGGGPSKKKPKNERHVTPTSEPPPNTEERRSKRCMDKEQKLQKSEKRLRR
jgi:hypothetical protein